MPTKPSKLQKEIAALKAELEPIKHSHQGDASWRRYQELSNKLSRLEGKGVRI